MTSDRVAAIHEAAHATAALMAGLDVRQIRLHRGSYTGPDGQRGYCELAEGAEEYQTNPSGYMEFYLAGFAADSRLGVPHAAERARGDFQQARRLAITALKVRPDDPRIQSHITSVAVLLAARMSDPALWGWIERVAAALIKQRRLSGREIQELHPEWPR